MHASLLFFLKHPRSKWCISLLLDHPRCLFLGQCHCQKETCRWNILVKKIFLRFMSQASVSRRRSGGPTTQPARLAPSTASSRNEETMGVCWTQAVRSSTCHPKPCTNSTAIWTAPATCCLPDMVQLANSGRKNIIMENCLVFKT